MLTSFSFFLSVFPPFLTFPVSCVYLGRGSRTGLPRQERHSVVLHTILGVRIVHPESSQLSNPACGKDRQGLFRPTKAEYTHTTQDFPPIRTRFDRTKGEKNEKKKKTNTTFRRGVAKPHLRFYTHATRLKSLLPHPLARAYNNTTTIHLVISH